MKYYWKKKVSQEEDKGKNEAIKMKTKTKIGMVIVVILILAAVMATIGCIEQETCRKCGGDGKCEHCGGDGIVVRTSVGTDTSVREETCPVCDGTGDCQECGGDGQTPGFELFGVALAIGLCVGTMGWRRRKIRRR